MIGNLPKFAEFVEVVSSSWRLKIALVWISFVAVAVPAAVLLTWGLPILPVMIGVLSGVLPVQYLAYVFLLRGFFTRHIVVDVPTVSSFAGIGDRVVPAVFSTRDLVVIFVRPQSESIPNVLPKEPKPLTLAMGEPLHVADRNLVLERAAS